MFIHQLIEKIEEQSLVHDFLFKDHESYLAHVFKMYDSANEGEWQVGYYSPKDACIHVFIYDEEVDSVIKNPGEEAFKEPGSEIKKLVIADVKIDIEDAFTKANDEVDKLGESITKRIVVLQNIVGSGLVYNFTFISKSMKTINVKISADNGSVISTNSFSLFDMAKENGILTK